MQVLDIGPTPAEEDCESLGPNYNVARARLECRTFIELIRRTVGQEPVGARLVIQSNPHDFGTYHDVAVKYDEDDQEARDYAFKVESEAPSEWDEAARQALDLHPVLEVPRDKWKALIEAIGPFDSRPALKALIEEIEKKPA